MVVVVTSFDVLVVDKGAVNTHTHIHVIYTDNKWQYFYYFMDRTIIQSKSEFVTEWYRFLRIYEKFNYEH